MEIVALYAVELPEQQAVPGGSHPVQHNIHPLDSSRGFARALLPLHQNESEPTPVLHLLLKTRGAETSLISLARWSPPLCVFPVLCFQSRCTTTAVWHAQTPLGWPFSSLCPDSTEQSKNKRSL